MTLIIVSIGVIVVGTILYFTYRQYIGHLNRIDDFVKNQAKDKGLKIQTITYPTFSEWKDEPFDKEIKIGTLGLSGIPTNEEYLRIIECMDLASHAQRTFWIKVTNNRRTKTLTSEWKERT